MSTHELPRYPPMVVYKDLRKSNFFSALGLPSFLRDWLLKKFADDDGNLDIDELTDFIRTYLPNKEEWVKIKDTRLVSIMMANNEIGSIQDISALSSVAHSHGAVFHTDAVQAVGHVEIDVDTLGVDMLSASAHKFNGPKGIGFLYVRKNTPLAAYLSGGSQERNMRAGTENIASIVGMAVALEKNVSQIAKVKSHLESLENMLLQGLLNSNIVFSRNGSAKRIPGNISLSFPGYDGEALLHRLDLMGICVSTGSACDSKETKTSHVLEAICLRPDLAKGTIRISLGKHNTEQDVHAILEALKRIMS